MHWLTEREKGVSDNIIHLRYWKQVSKLSTHTQAQSIRDFKPHTHTQIYLVYTAVVLRLLRECTEASTCRQPVGVKSCLFCACPGGSSARMRTTDLESRHASLSRPSRRNGATHKASRDVRHRQLPSETTGHLASQASPSFLPSYFLQSFHPRFSHRILGYA